MNPPCNITGIAIIKLKILFSNKYYYVSTKLEELFEGRGNVKSITILLYTGQFKATMWGDRISFDCSDGGKIEFKIETTAKEAGQQWGWNTTLHWYNRKWLPGSNSLKTLLSQCVYSDHPPHSEWHVQPHNPCLHQGSNWNRNKFWITFQYKKHKLFKPLCIAWHRS